MSEIENLEVLGPDENRDVDFPAVILDARFARKLIEANELPLVVHQALDAMELSGQRVAVVTST